MLQGGVKSKRGPKNKVREERWGRAASCCALGALRQHLSGALYEFHSGGQDVLLHRLDSIANNLGRHPYLVLQAGSYTSEVNEWGTSRTYIYEVGDCLWLKPHEVRGNDPNFATCPECQQQLALTTQLGWRHVEDTFCTYKRTRGENDGQ